MCVRVDEVNTVTGEVHRQIPVIDRLLYHPLASIEKAHARIRSGHMDLLFITSPVVGERDGEPTEIKATIQGQVVAVSVVRTVDA